MVRSPHDSGLSLFDETATAAGNFPPSRRGYDRTAVDDYVRTLEGSVASLRSYALGLEQQVAELQETMQEGSDSPPEPPSVAAASIELQREAEDRAADIVQQAQREAAQIHATARHAIDAVEADGSAPGREPESFHADAGALLDAARGEAEAIRQAVRHEAEALRRAAELDADRLLRSAEREIAEARSQIAAEREQGTVALRASHDEAVERTSELMAQANQLYDESAARLEENIAKAAQIRAEAEAYAEEAKLKAEAEHQALGDDVRRESELLNRRRQALVTQLASLTALAKDTARDLPDLPLLELDDEPDDTPASEPDSESAPEEDL